MYTFLHAKFKFAIRRNINSNKRIAVALSGGQDSLCLLKLLVDCLDKSQQTISAVYIDHQWKNSSQKHAKHVINMSKFTELPITIYQMPKLSISEHEARKIRYRILIKHALAQECDAIMLGHNSDDHTETLIGNLLRGAGLDGIANFTTSKQINSRISMLRPLIYFTKAEITWMCRLFQLPVWSDETNYNLNLRRSRVRHELVPYLQNFFNPSVQQTLKHFSHLCELENEYIRENTIKLYLKSAHEKFTGVNLYYVKKQHEVLQKRVLRLYFYYNFNIEICNKVIEWILADKMMQPLIVTNSNQINLWRTHQWLYISVKEEA